MTSPRSIALATAIASLVLPAAGRAAVDNPDIVRGIEVRPAPAGAVIVVHGTRAPVFSVFRLATPDRIVLDLAGADVSRANRPSVSGVPGLTSVSAVQFQRGDSRVGRIVLAASADLRYDARVEGDDVVLSLSSTRSAPADASAPSREAPAAKTAAVEGAPPAAPLERPTVAKPEAEPHLIERVASKGRAGGRRVLAVSGAEEAGRLALRIRTDGPVGSYTLLRLRDPARVAIDLPGFGGRRARTRAGPGVTGIRLGRGGNAVRIVFDLGRGEPPLLAVRRTRSGLVLTGAPAVAARPKVSGTAMARGAALRDLRVTGDAAGEKVVVEIPDGAGASLPQISAAGDGRFEMTLPGMAVPAKLRRTLDASAFGGPISTVSAFDLGTQGRIVVAAAPGTKQALRREGRSLVWAFTSAPPTPAAQAAAAEAAVRIAVAQSSGEAAGFSTAAAEAGAVSARRPRFTGRRISLEFKDIDIQNLLRLFAEISHRNLVVADDVKGRVTISLRNVPWDQAFDLILRTHGLGKEEVGNIIRVAPQAELDKERKEALDALHAEQQLEPLKVRLIPVNYALAGDVADKIKDVLSDRGVVTVDQRTNVLIVKDVVENLAKAEGMVRNLDTQTPEVLIESRIVEAATTFARQLGIQWGGNGGFAPIYGNTTGLVFPSLATVAGAAGDAPNLGTGGTPNFAVNLPAAIGQGQGGGLGFIFGSAGGAINLNLRISALENNGLVKTVSAPKVATLDNNEADISQGLSIPFSQVSAAGVQTTFIEARLELKVTPHVTADGSILMKINATNNQPNAGITGANGQPSISRKEAKTQMLVKDGDTTVIGGIYTRQTGVQINEVPFFGRIPVLGWLFKSRSDSDARTELLIFITPRILNRQQVVSAGAGG